MSVLRTREFQCDVYRPDGIDAYPNRSELYIGTTTAFLVYSDGDVRQLSAGVDASIHECINGCEPVREDTIELIKYDGSFFTTDDSVEEVKIGKHYLVDGDVVFTVTSKTNRVKKQMPIGEITEDEFSPDHQAVYVVQRQNPFGRFQYRANAVRRFVKSDRVSQLVRVADS